MVSVERALIERAFLALCDEFTTAGHYALKNTREHRGGCSPKRCQTPCVERVELLADLAEYVGAQLERVAAT